MQRGRRREDSFKVRCTANIKASIGTIYENLSVNVDNGVVGLACYDSHGFLCSSMISVRPKGQDLSRSKGYFID